MVSLRLAFFVSLSSLSSVLAQGSADIKTAYTPQVGSCPSDFQLVRSAGLTNQSLSPDESSYISTRQSQVLPGAWKTYLANVQATNVSLPSYVSSILSSSSNGSLPTLGIATSGGGYRAAIFGAGILNALDGRNASSTSAGIGGLLQAATYLSGLSGGSWLVTSTLQANFPTFQEVVFGPPNGSDVSPSDYGGWNAQFDITAPNNSTVEDLAYVLNVLTEVSGKLQAGFPVTIADAWARLLARHFVNGTQSSDFFGNDTTHGAGVLFSQIANTTSFVNHDVPFPIVIATSQSKNENRSNIDSAGGDFIPLTNTIFEFTPFEMGSYDPTLGSFTPTKYLGTTNTSVCVTNFDQASFIVGTSSELFNEFNITVQDLLQSSAGPLISILNSTFMQSTNKVELDLSYYPNPFFGVQNGTFIDSKQAFLGLADGGEDGEVVPIQPLLVKARNVDVIFAIDATSDSDNYAAGSSLVATANRTTFFPSAYSFPQVPNDTSVFTSQNLTHHPTFFGCNESSPVPLVIYLANGAAPSGLPPLTNTTTTQTKYQPADVQAMLDETYVIATQGFPANASETKDSEWPACLACAVVDRARAETGAERTGVCADCFERYCWSPDHQLASSSSSSSSSNSAASRISFSLTGFRWATTLLIALSTFLL